jgi:ABC-2 type transport system permease protein
MGLYVLLGVVVVLIILRRFVLPMLSKRGGSSRRLIKNRSYIALKGLTIASMKMYFRNRTAIFFSLFFPVVFIVVFGFIFKNNSTSFKIDLTNESNTQLATSFEHALKQVPAFKITDTSVSAGSDALNQGKTDLTVVIPASFGTTKNGRIQNSTVSAQYNAANPGTGQAAAQIVQQLTSGFNDQITKTPTVVSIDATGVKTKNLNYIDFLLPGMIGLSVMQIGIFSVAFAFVSYKTTGMLRRLQATPIHPSSFLAAQGFTRLIVAVVQTILLAGIGVALFSFHLDPKSYLSFLVLALIGSAVFQMIGFGIAGWAKDENQAQPVTQLIQFPMMFLSGIFFPRDSFPHILNVLTGFLPLTYLADALRQVANNDASLWAVRGDLLGLIVWGIIAFVIAVRLFSWE